MSTTKARRAPRKAKPVAVTYYKVVSADALAMNGGNFNYSPHLPALNADGTWTPGEWTPTVCGALDACSNGYHVTSRPARWWHQAGARCFEIEHDGECTKVHDGEKIACRSIRLLREVTDHAELARVNVYLSGSHNIGGNTQGAIVAGSAVVSVSGNATVKSVSGNATVESVSGNATVKYVYGNATVKYVSDNATVKYVSDNATVEYVSDNATVESVSGNATVKSVSDNATVESVSGNATVESVYGNATVESVYGNATVNLAGSAVATTPGGTWGVPTVTVAEYAVWIDRRSGKPQIHAVTGAATMTAHEPIA